MANDYTREGLVFFIGILVILISGMIIAASMEEPKPSKEWTIIGMKVGLFGLLLMSYSIISWIMVLPSVHDR